MGRTLLWKLWKGCSPSSQRISRRIWWRQSYCPAPWSTIYLIDEEILPMLLLLILKHFVSATKEKQRLIVRKEPIKRKQNLRLYFILFNTCFWFEIAYFHIAWTIYGSVGFVVETQRVEGEVKGLSRWVEKSFRRMQRLKQSISLWYRLW
jgi:hypothetical protein